MEARKPATVALTVLAYLVATFGVQGASHFAINTHHYAAISFLRAEPIVPMGITAMLIQGLILATLFPMWRRDGATLADAIKFAWLVGAFLTSYITLAEAGKYAVPFIASWIAVETGAAFVQFTLFGVLLGLIHRRGHAIQRGAGAAHP